MAATFFMDALDVGGFITILLLVIVAGWIVLYIKIRQVMFAEIEELRSMIYTHTRAEEQQRPPAPAVAAPASPKKSAEPVHATPATPAADKGEVSAEILAIISAAVAAYLFKAVRVRRARPLPAYGVSPWAQQGRVFIQASHNLAFRAHA